MLSKKPTLLTNEGLERLTKELEHLRTVGREEVAERLHQAFQDGQDDDFVDNAELEAARNAQAFLEGRIQELDEILNNYQLIDEDMAPTTVSSLAIGSPSQKSARMKTSATSWLARWRLTRWRVAFRTKVLWASCWSASRWARWYASMPLAASLNSGWFR